MVNRRKSTELQMLDIAAQISRLFFLGGDLETCLPDVFDALQPALPCDRLTLSLFVWQQAYQIDDSGHVKTRRWSSAVTDEQAAASVWVFRHAQPILRRDIVVERRFDYDAQRIADGLRSDIVVPLRIRDDVLGAMGFMGKTPDRYTTDHLKLAEGFADVVAVCVQEFMLRKASDHLREIAAALQHTFDLEQVLEMILSHIQSQGYDRVRVYLYDAASDALVGAAQVGIAQMADFNALRLPVSEDPFSRETLLGQTAQIYHRESAESAPFEQLGPILEHPFEHEWAELPLFVIEDGTPRVVGKISLDNTPSGRPLAQARIDRLMTYAAQAANAVRQAQLYRQMNEQIDRRTAALVQANQQLEVLLEINRAVLEMKHPQELDRVSQVCIEAIGRLGINAQAMAIHRVIDPEICEVETYRVGQDGLITVGERRKATTLVRAWKRKELLRVDGTAHATAEDTSYMRQKFQGLDIKSYIDVPFSEGIVSMQSTDVEAFSERDIEVLQQIAEIFSVGIARLNDLEALEEQYWALEESETRYRNLIRMANGVAYAFDFSTGHYTYMDESIRELTGYASREFTQELMSELIQESRILQREKTTPAHIQLVERMPSSLYHAEYEMRSRSGQTIWVEDFSIEFRNEDHELVRSFGMLQDITARRKLEHGLRQSQKMEAVGQLAGGVAHDFNNILTGILGVASLMLNDMPADHVLRPDVEEIRRAGERAASLTRQLLAFSRKQVMQAQQLDLNAVLSDMQQMLRRLIREDIDLVVTLGTAVGPVVADPGQLEQVIMNLVVNARDAMPEGGTLTIQTGSIVLDDAQPCVGGTIAPGSYVCMRVRDTGIGMRPDIQTRIFEPFFTTKASGQGTGMGLAMVYGIVAQSNGHIQLRSAPGKGTDFAIYFPWSEPLPDLLAAGDGAVEMPGGTEAILLVEDEEMVRQLVYRVLNDLGYRVEVATNGADALALYDTLEGDIALLVTDVVMPGLGGRELADQLRTQRPGLRVLFMSGYSDQLVDQNDFLDLDTAYLQKPFFPEEFAQKVRAVLDA